MTSRVGRTMDRLPCPSSRGIILCDDVIRKIGLNDDRKGKVEIMPISRWPCSLHSNIPGRKKMVMTKI